MDDNEVPSHFLCPISLQPMVDPVTISTGITYDRDNIRRWLYSLNNNTCPVTKQVLIDTNLTPNHTLRRLIQTWCNFKASHGSSVQVLLNHSFDRSQIVKLINDAKNCPENGLKLLKSIKIMAFESERSKRCLEEAGVVEFLASIIRKEENIYDDDEDGDQDETSLGPKDEALNILYHLETSEANLKRLISNGSDFAESLVQILMKGNYQSRAYATMLLKSIISVADPIQLISIKLDFFVEILRVLQDHISQQASKAALKLLVELCPWGRNRIKAVEGGAVFVLIELLLETTERRTCELILNVLDQLCACAEGRAELLKHGAGLAVVSKKILRVSHGASDRAMRILSSVSRFSGTCRVLQEMLQVGVVSKLCLVLQVDSSFKTKERAREILRLHSRVWRNSPCIPSHLLSSYPSA